MNSLRHYPLGEPVPNSPHAVVSSLPTMTDVRGYEEKDPRVLQALSSGYPRFVMHAYIRELIELYNASEPLGETRGVALVPARRAAEDLCRFVGGAVGALEVEDGLFLIHTPEADGDLAARIGKYVQHTGCGISSRRAEALLVHHGRLGRRHPEPLFAGNAEAEAESRLAELCACRRADILICASGMNAFYSAFRSVQAFQRNRGRGRWLQLGWLYLDSGCILQEFLEDGETVDYCYDVRDTGTLVEVIESIGSQLAGVVVECPTNPLVQVCDLKRVAAAVRGVGGVLIVDPTMASVYNVAVLQHADILVTSLTKYASNEGDVMIGALVLNPDSPYYGDLAPGTSAFHVPPYAGDLARLAQEMQDAAAVVGRMNANAARIARFLHEHPAVERVYYPKSENNFAAVAKADDSAGAVVSVVLKGSMERFYDRVAVLKGPSFGTRFSMLSPFMYLAHYDLVTTADGRAFLEEVGIAPDLIRISVGVEPCAEIESVLREALDASV